MSTLTAFGVPNGDGTGRGGILMPKTKDRFRVRVFNFGVIGAGIELTQQVMRCSRPNPSTAEQEVWAYNSVMYYPGKTTWATISLGCRDDITNSLTTLVGAQLQRQKNHLTQTTALSGSDVKFTLILEALTGGDDGTLEDWTLEGCFLTETNFGDFEYSSAEPMTIEMTIRYDNATLGGGLMPIAPQLGNSFGI